MPGHHFNTVVCVCLCMWICISGAEKEAMEGKEKYGRISPCIHVYVCMYVCVRSRFLSLTCVSMCYSVCVFLKMHG